MNIWHEIYTLLQSKHRLYLLTVVQSLGSAPGRRGFKMVVTDDGQLYGSIGGGIMEFNMVERAKLLLQQRCIEQQAIKQVHKGDSATSSGMICSGSQIIGFNYLSPQDLSLVNSIIQSTEKIKYSSTGISLVKSDKDSSFVFNDKDSWHYLERNKRKTVAHIFGAGHVSVPTSALLVQLGFDVFLYDNRDKINTFEQNNFVNEKRIIGYDNVLNEVVIAAQDFVLLMTHKFTEDKLLLSQLLSLDIAYLGVLGSQNKINVMFDALQAQGICLTQLQKVHAPVGVDIKSQTTQEIAISIAAEIIKTKNH